MDSALRSAASMAARGQHRSKSTLAQTVRPACRLPMLTVGTRKVGVSTTPEEELPATSAAVYSIAEIAPEAKALHKAGAVRVGSGKSLHHAGADLAACIGVGAGDKPEHTVHGGHSRAQGLHLRRRAARIGGGLGVVGHQRKGLHQGESCRIAQFPAAHFGHCADIFIPQPAYAEHCAGRLAHTHEPRSAVGAGRKCTAAILEMQWR